jgi:hypothetical protein
MLYEVALRMSDGSYRKLIYDSETSELRDADSGKMVFWDAPRRLVVRVPERIKNTILGV